MREQTQTLTLTLTLTQTQTSSSPPPPPPRKSRKLSSNSSPQKPAVATGKAIPQQPTKTLSCDGEVDKATKHLRKSDPRLVSIVDAHDPPVFTNFDPPFLALAKIILYQQITHKAGTAIYNRFVSLCGGEARVCPISVLPLTPPQLLQIGFSARKVSFLHDLANKFRTGILSDTKIVGMEDRALVAVITMVKGFGVSSVHSFLIFTLHRPDVLAFNDVNVRKGVQILYGLEQLPRPSQMEALCEHWRPYRSVASWYMWKLVEANGAQVKLETCSGRLPKQLQPLEVSPKQFQSESQEVLLVENSSATDPG